MKEIPENTDRLAAPWGLVVVATILFSLAGMICLLVMTRWGIGTSPDSVHYIQAARHLADERDGALAAGHDASLTQHAPLYPFLLAAGGLVGVDPLDGARWLNGALFGLNIFLVGFVVRLSSRNVPWLWVVASIIMLGSIPMLSVHAVALSEPLFLAMGLAGWYLLAVYVENGKQGFLLGAGLVFGLAFLARYAGAAYILAGGLAVLLLSSKTLSGRFRDAFLFSVIGSLPMFLWMVKNLTDASTATGRELFFHPVGRSHFWQALYTASGWTLISSSAPDIVRLAVWLVLIVGSAAILIGRSAAGLSIPPVIPVLVLFIGTYGAFLAASISFFDANTPLDDRILLPVFAAGLIVLLYVLDCLWPSVQRHRGVAPVILTAMLVFVGAHVARGVEAISVSYAGGLGFNSQVWRRSATLARVRELPVRLLIYSNAPEVVYLHTGRTVEPVPKKWLLMNQQPNPDYEKEIMETRRQLDAGCGVVVYFRGLTQKSMPSERDLKAQLSLRERAAESDGSILGASTCQQ